MIRLLLLIAFLGPFQSLSASPPIRLARDGGGLETLDALLGDGYKVLVFTKPWCELTQELVDSLHHYKIRLNKGELRTTLVFPRTPAPEARHAARSAKGEVPFLLDPAGEAATRLEVQTLPSIVVVNPSGLPIYRTPYLTRELLRQLAAHYPELPRLRPPAHRYRQDVALPGTTGSEGSRPIR